MEASTVRRILFQRADAIFETLNCQTMEYEGRLFGKVGKSYIPLTNVTGDFKMLETRVRELEAEILTLRKSEHLHKPNRLVSDFVEHLSDNYGIEISDMIVQDYLKYRADGSEPLPAEGSAKGVSDGDKAGAVAHNVVANMCS